MAAEGVRMRFIGDRAAWIRALHEADGAGSRRSTAGNTRLKLTVAINYGGRDELAPAAAQLARDMPRRVDRRGRD